MKTVSFDKPFVPGVKRGVSSLTVREMGEQLARVNDESRAVLAEASCSCEWYEECASCDARIKAENEAKRVSAIRPVTSGRYWHEERYGKFGEVGV